MSRKSKRERDKPRQSGKPRIPPRSSQVAIGKPAKRVLFLTVLGLVLTATGLVALVELFPRLSSTADSPTDMGDELGSSRFTVANDGYLKVTDVMSACFLWKVDLRGAGTVHMVGDLARVVVPPASALRPTEGYTVPCTPEHLVGAAPPFRPPTISSADLAVVAYYRAWPFTFYRTHRLFRFVARIAPSGQIIWDKQPTPEAMEADYNHFIQSHGGRFPPTGPAQSR